MVSGLRSPAAASRPPWRGADPLHSDHPAIQNVGKRWAARRGGVALWPQLPGGRLRPRLATWLARRFAYCSWQTQSQVICPKRTALSAQRRRPEEVWLCGCLQTEQAGFCSLVQCRVADGQHVLWSVGSCWSSPVFRKAVFYRQLLLSLVSGVHQVSSSSLNLQNLALLFLIIQLKNYSSPAG